VQLLSGAAITKLSVPTDLADGDKDR